MGHCWRSKDELMNDILLWTTLHRRASVGQPARTYLQQLYIDTGCSLEDQLEAMDDEDRWWEREIRKSMRKACHDNDIFIFTKYVWKVIGQYFMSSSNMISCEYMSVTFAFCNLCIFILHFLLFRWFSYNHRGMNEQWTLSNE